MHPAVNRGGKTRGEVGRGAADCLQRVPAYREGLRVVQDEPIPAYYRHVVREELAAVAVLRERAQYSGGLPCVSPGRNEHRSPFRDYASGMYERVPLSDQHPAQDRFDYVGIKDVGGPPEQATSYHLHELAARDINPEPEKARDLPVAEHVAIPGDRRLQLFRANARAPDLYPYIGSLNHMRSAEEIELH